MFGATNIVKDNDKEKHEYSSYGIAFDGKGSWSFNDNFAKNVIIFGVLIVVHHLILTILKIIF